MAGTCDLADRRDHLLVIDDAPAVVARHRRGRCRNEIDRNAHALSLLALTPADADAAHQDEAADCDGVGCCRRRFGVSLDHLVTMPERHRSPQCAREQPCYLAGAATASRDRWASSTLSSE